MKLVRFGIFIILMLGVAACSQLPDPTDLTLEAQLREKQKLTVSAAQNYQNYGNSVAVDGDFMVVGAYAYDIGSQAYQAAAYLYQKDVTGNWQFVKKLVASDGAESDDFGWSVAISGTTVVVGAPADDSDTNTDQGSAYIFERDQGGTNAWGEVKKLVASDGAEGDSFGFSVAISGNTVVAVASGDDIGIHADQGSAYIFSRNRGGTNAWGRVKKLLASDGADSDYFGHSVAISGNTVVVGNAFDDIGTNGDQGSAYIFERDQGGTNTWGEVKKLVASDGAAINWFGLSVTISGNTVVIGAPINNGNNGSAYIFERHQGGTNTWGEVKKLVASDGVVGDSFGWSVAISGNTVVVGVPGRGKGRGRAYLYKRDIGGLNNWGQSKMLFASDRANYDTNGHAVAVSGNTIVVGAPGDDIDTNIDQGSVYIFND